MSGKEINNNEKFAEVYEQLPQNVKDRLTFKNTEPYDDWQKRVKPPSDATTVNHMATPWFNQGVTIMGPAGYFVAETQINREHARVDTYLALANAEHIVKCVNAHQGLIADRDALREALDKAIYYVGLIPNKELSGDDPIYGLLDKWTELVNNRDAHAKAQPYDQKAVLDGGFGRP